MTAAKEALQTVQADRPELFDSSLKATGSQAALQADFQSLVSAVQSGDSASAQGALTKLQSDVKEGRGHHHHHRHHHDDGSPATTPSAGSSQAAGDSAGTATAGTATPGSDKDGDADRH